MRISARRFCRTGKAAAIASQRPAHVEFPDDEYIAGPQLTQHLIERGPRGLRAAGDVLIDALAAGALERV
jgi:hypothetical protein